YSLAVLVVTVSRYGWARTTPPSPWPISVASSVRSWPPVEPTSSSGQPNTRNISMLAGPRKSRNNNKRQARLDRRAHIPHPRPTLTTPSPPPPLLPPKRHCRLRHLHRSKRSCRHSEKRTESWHGSASGKVWPRSKSGLCSWVKSVWSARKKRRNGTGCVTNVSELWRRRRWRRRKPSTSSSCCNDSNNN
ncbi:hypothetical protein BGZ52_012268, partial [Haplosporangium bisporale]